MSTDDHALSALSESLADLKDFLRSEDELLERPTVKRFYDLWLSDFMLDEQRQHSRLVFTDGPVAAVDLKYQAAELLHW